jgi:DNA-binding MarR family transcriptional regulator
MRRTSTLQVQAGGHGGRDSAGGSMTDVVDDALIGMTRLVMDVSVRASDALGNVSLVQLRALTVLAEAPGASLAVLADGMGVAVSTASRLVDRLSAAGWVVRGASEEDRRTLALQLTASGSELLGRYDRLRLTSLHRHLDLLDATRRAAMLDGLVELVAATREERRRQRGG